MNLYMGAGLSSPYYWKSDEWTDLVEANVVLTKFEHVDGVNVVLE